MKTVPTVSIIIVNWNGKKHLKDCFKSLSNILFHSIEVIVVDNASTDGSQAYIRSVKKPHTILVQNKDNKGFAEANNIGVEHSRGKYVLFLNNDTVVEKHFLTILIKKLESNKKIAAVQPKILQYPNTKFIDSVGSYFASSGFLYHAGHNKSETEKFNIPSQIYSMKGACMLFRKTVLDKLGVFDPDYFAYFEETDLCHRVLLSGYQIWYEPRAIIYHKGGQTSMHIASTYITFHAYKNRILTYLKNLEGKTMVRILPTHYLLCEIISFVYLITGKISLFLSVQKALLWPLFNMKQIYMKRHVVQNMRKVRDEEYLPTVTKNVRMSYYYHLYSTSLKGYID